MVKEKKAFRVDLGFLLCVYVCVCVCVCVFSRTSFTFC